MDQDLKVFRDLVLWLWDNHEKPWDYKNPKARKVYDKIKQGYNSILSREDLELVLPTERSVRLGFPSNRYLYLNPIQEDSVIIPVLKLSADFGRFVPEIRMRLGLFVHKGGSTRAFGYRFESPEGLGGLHHYYHAQFIRGFEKDQPFMPKNIWLPDGCPTFPLDADNPVKLLLSLVVALYGLSSLTQVKASVPGIEKHLGEMHCPSFREFEYYWVVTMRRDQQEYHVSTTIDPESFGKEFRKAYQGCEISRITKGAYEIQTRQYRWDGKRLKEARMSQSRHVSSSRRS